MVRYESSGRRLNTLLKNITNDFCEVVEQVYAPWTNLFKRTSGYRARMGCTNGFRRAF